MASKAAGVQLLRRGTPLPPLAYERIVGLKSPGIVFTHGFMSNMMAEKAEALFNFAANKGHSFVRFDHSFCGESNGADATPFYSFERWRHDLLQVIDELTEGPQILVGSSMGGWLSLTAALERPQRVAALVLVSVAVGFFENHLATLQQNFADKWKSYEAGETVWIEGSWGQYPLNKSLVEESKQWNLLKNAQLPLPIGCPVRLLHSQRDDVAPYKVALWLVDNIASGDICVTLRKEGDHRMSEKADLDLLRSTVDQLIETLQEHDNSI